MCSIIVLWWFLAQGPNDDIQDHPGDEDDDGNCEADASYVVNHGMFSIQKVFGVVPTRSAVGQTTGECLDRLPPYELIYGVSELDRRERALRA